jgi:hypothetical protein
MTIAAQTSHLLRLCGLTINVVMGILLVDVTGVSKNGSKNAGHLFLFLFGHH